MIRKIFYSLALPLFLCSYEGYMAPEGPGIPWFTGPILASSGNIVPVGHFNVQGYFAAINRSSFYNNQWNSESIDTLWNLRFLSPVWAGITEWADLKLIPVWQWNERNGIHQWVLCDCGVQLDMQIHKDLHKNWLPAVKISLREVFPTGPYKNLDPKKLGTDGGGDGCYRTWMSLNASKVMHIRDDHFLNLYFNVAYSLASKVHVKGFNAYGGGYGTDGVIDAEDIFFAVFAFEYSLSRRWAFACDAQAIFCGDTAFSGNPGIVPDSDTSIEPMGVPSSNIRRACVQYVLSPAIEYNWSSNVGAIFGTVFTVAGKNSSNFTSAVFSINYYH